MNAEQLSELQVDEGFRLRVYDDASGLPIVPGSIVKGHPTIGYGRSLDLQGLTAQESEYLLTNDIEDIQSELSHLAWYTALDAIRQGVIINLAYNMGVSGLLQFVDMIGALEKKDFKTAAEQLRLSEWVHQVQASRSTRLIKQMTTGILDSTVQV